jgi:NAD(P)-dependent dehydrogenase (short-subunit alcohol dehydrogenase family)
MVNDVGGDGIVTVGDLTDVDDNRRCIHETVESFGGLDTVVNSAALPGGGGSPTSVPLESWDAVMDLNLRAAFLVARHAMPHLIEAGGGSIVNISTVAASLGHGSGAYAASKAALEALSRDWAFSHGRQNIRVNSIEIGHIHTPMGRRNGDARRRRRVRTRSRCSTSATPSDSAAELDVGRDEDAVEARPLHGLGELGHRRLEVGGQPQPCLESERDDGEVVLVAESDRAENLVRCPQHPPHDVEGRPTQGERVDERRLRRCVHAVQRVERERSACRARCTIRWAWHRISTLEEQKWSTRLR